MEINVREISTSIPNGGNASIECTSAVYSGGNSAASGDAPLKTRRPLGVFISFSTVQQDLCRHVRDTLKAWGHYPWFDMDHVKSGVNLREEISKGLGDVSSGVFCLSQEAVQSQWCREELRFLRREAGDDNIHVLRLDNTKPQDLPSELSFLRNKKWLDLTQWEKRRELDPDMGGAFAFWFKHELSELFYALENGEGPDAVVQRRGIRDRLGISPDTFKQDDLLRRGIVGREWLMERVRA